MMMKSIHFTLVLLVLLTGAYCKKNEPVPKTYITIEFVDSATGAVLDSVYYYINFYNPETGAAYSTNNLTGSDGKINLEITDAALPVSMDSYRIGYGNKFGTGFNIIRGETNRVVVPMYRFNCTIRLDVKNNTAETDSVYIRLENGVLEGGNGSSAGQFPYFNPFEVLPFQTQTYYVPAVADDPVSIFWSWNTNEWSAQYPLPLKNVLILAENDTLIYTISN